MLLGTMRRDGGMKGLSSLVAKIFPTASPVDRQLMIVFAQWCRSVPERVVMQAQPVRVRAGALTVHTRTAAWANLLQLESESLLATLRARYPSCGVQSLTFRPGPFPDLPIPRKEEAPPPTVRPLRMLPEELAVQLVRIRSDTLRDAIARAAAVGLGERVARPPSAEYLAAVRNLPKGGRSRADAESSRFAQDRLSSLENSSKKPR